MLGAQIDINNLQAQEANDLAITCELLNLLLLIYLL